MPVGWSVTDAKQPDRISEIHTNLSSVIRGRFNVSIYLSTSCPDGVPGFVASSVDSSIPMSISNTLLSDAIPMISMFDAKSSRTISDF